MKLVQFGTVEDYFNALRNIKAAPILDGDFFPYMDKPQSATPYWTGFYNHRAYFKRFERIVQSELRLLDLLSVATRKQPRSGVELARRNLALCQHHDAITGTSTRDVMDDYMHRYRIQIVNQKAFRAHELIKVNTSSALVTVSQDGEAVIAQAVPIHGVDDLYEISFLALLEPFSATIVTIQLEKSQSAATVLTPLTDLTKRTAKLVFLAFSLPNTSKFPYPSKRKTNKSEKEWIYSVSW
ncbi:unnamed protein product [Gongylonema pulchrum]|uniref:Alpha-mann_mid domain-containing protein n=1 Tax=Gongylonema pulchrum TaxID=637853 RepID=A0A183D0C5_9BILA|nr:unnamed protein product [Gongylonema pulchrum]